MTALFCLTETFFVLHCLDILNDNFVQLGVILATQSIVQAITDYPTGAVGDWIGQRWVLITSALVFASGYVVLSQATGFTSLLVAFVLIALARGQESGALTSWFDNNYKLYAPEDSELKTYTELRGKLSMFGQLVLAITFICGGFLMATEGRPRVFLIQGVAVAAYSLVFFLFVTDHPSLQRKSPKLREYFGILKSGVNTAINDKVLRIWIIGSMVTFGQIVIWAQLLLFPWYESYAKTDDLIGIMRSVIFISAAFLVGIISHFVKKIKAYERVLAWMLVLDSLAFLLVVIFLHWQFPAGDEFDMTKYIVVIVAFSLFGIPRAFLIVLTPRFMLEAVPDETRNSIYSLTPTLILLSSTVAAVIGGYLIDNLDFFSVLWILCAWGTIGGCIMGSAVIKHSKRPTEPVASSIPASIQEKE